MALAAAIRHPLRRGLATAAAAAPSYGYNPATNPPPTNLDPQASVQWPAFADVTTFMADLDLAGLSEDYKHRGYSVVPGVIPADCLDVYRQVHDDMHSGKIDASRTRHDLGSHKDAAVKGKENVGQIMWPSDLVAELTRGPIHQRAFAVCRHLLGDDTAFDFDMLIYKDAQTETETPWHQDAACE